MAALDESINRGGPDSVRELLSRHNDGSTSGLPQVSCMVLDSLTTFPASVAEQIGVPCVFLWSPSPCAFLGTLLLPRLIEMGIVPLKGMNYELLLPRSYTVMGDGLNSVVLLAFFKLQIRVT